MTRSAGSLGGGRPSIQDQPRFRTGLGIAVAGVGIWLAWQVVGAFAAERLPGEMAIRLAPGSPTVLAKAAESELAAGRTDNAGELAGDALARAPFNVRALRILGLVEAQEGRRAEADEMLTLAGNWSLRDDPAHAWLVENRLRQGDYSSAFAHADTLARRRTAAQATVFRLFTEAALVDRRALGALAQLLDRDPPWRDAYLRDSMRAPTGRGLVANLAILLKTGKAPFTASETGALYYSLATAQQYAALRQVRQRLEGDRQAYLMDGDFTEAEPFGPFGWRLRPTAGATAEMMDDGPPPEGSALFVRHDGYSTGTLVDQLTILPPGPFRISGSSKIDVGDAQRLTWTVACAGTGVVIARSPASGSPGRGWTSWTTDFQVPAEQGCDAQLVMLTPNPGDHRSPQEAWFRNLSIASRANARK